MPSNVPLTLRQSNDEIIDVVITSSSAIDDLSLVTQLVCVLKPDQCTADSDVSALTLTSADPTEITITAQTATSLSATIYVPASALVLPYSRWWRVDAHVGTTKRTALYGPVTMIDL